MRIVIICLGFILDSLLGDPQWLWHPVRGIGRLITRTEVLLRRFCCKGDRSERIAGIFLWLIVCGVSFAVPLLLLYAAARIHPALRWCLEIWFCYQILARRSLQVESGKVYQCLKNNNIEEARTAVSYIVGRDTETLSQTGIVKAAVETVAENASDGVIAPMIFLFLGGAPLGFFYKAVNTLDSMVGYKNEKYLNLGAFSAKMDDILNYIPARISGLCMIVVAGILGMDYKNAFRIWKRDRRQHASPNAAQTEAAAAGALHVQLAGDAFYFGKRHSKPTIGDNDRPIDAEDIRRVNRLMTGASIFVLFLSAAMLVPFWVF